MAKRTLSEMRRQRHLRLRRKIRGTAHRPRLCVNRTLRHIHAQLIDDVAGATVVAASTLQQDIAGQLNGGKGGREAARLVGQEIARRAREKGIEAAIFDRNGYQFHGSVKELAEAAREGGLSF